LRNGTAVTIGGGNLPDVISSDPSTFTSNIVAVDGHHLRRRELGYR
jgi:hypothetical protein